MKINNNEDLLNVVLALKAYCENLPDCKGCIFDSGFKCKLNELYPSEWEIDNLE